MKNVIQYYYNLIPNDIRQNNKSYFFQIGNVYYYFTPYERDGADLEVLYQVSMYLLSRNIYCHQFVRNRANELVTLVNQVPYILFQYYVDISSKVGVQDILFFSNVSLYSNFSIEKNNNWKELWSQKNDYFEYQVSEFGKKFPLIRESFSYFLGVAETGITLLNQVPEDIFSNVILSHRRVSLDDTLLEFYNPLNFIFDVRVRDVAEYVKVKVIFEEFSFEEFCVLCVEMNFHNYELLLLFIRLLYPSFYFDRFERIIDGKEDELVLKDIIASVSKYELFLRNVYFYVKQFIHIDTIYWLEKK